MKKFKFRLEPLLKVKSHLERQKQKEHARAVEEVRRQKEVLSKLNADREATLNKQRGKLTGWISVAELLVCSRHLLKVKQNTVAGLEVLRGLEREAEQKRQSLIEASKQRQIYEKLRDRLQDKYLKEVARLDQKDTDEVAVRNCRSGERL